MGPHWPLFDTEESIDVVRPVPNQDGNLIATVRQSPEYRSKADCMDPHVVSKLTHHDVS